MNPNYIKKIKSINALFLNVQQFPLNPYNHTTQKNCKSFQTKHPPIHQ